MTRRSRQFIAALGVLVLGGGLFAAGTDRNLVDAAKRGDVATVRTELGKGVGVNATEPDGSTALHWAAYRGDADMASMLLRAGANANAANRYNVRPLSLACVTGNVALVRMLLDAKADPNAPLAEGETPLMTAAKTGVVGAVDALIAHGANVNAKETWRGQTALMWASAEGHSAVIRSLVAAGANLKAKSSKAFTPLLFAAREGRIDAVKTLLDLGSSLDESLAVNSAESAGGVAQTRPEAANLNAFLLASGNAHFELAAYLLDRGADPNAAPRGWTALHQVSWLRKMGDVGSNDPPPQGSGRMSSLEFVKALVAHKADVNAKVTTRALPVGSSGLNFNGATPFLLAARTADVPLMKLLLELGANPLQMTEGKTTPLLVAAGVGSSLPGEEPGTEAEMLEALKLLKELGDDINGVDATGNTAMHGAAYKHMPAVAQWLGDNGAKIEIWNQKNRAGFTPLDIAAGIQRGMNFVFSTPTEAVIRGLMLRAGVPTPSAKHATP